jgi:prepilin-type N-terminal cleavage/methylation domain-containing protein
MYSRPNLKKGFTLIETMVAVTLLSISIVAPMTLVTRSLSSAYYARDQITAFNLAQDALEGVRAIRDANVLNNALGLPVQNLFTGLVVPSDVPFTIDTINGNVVAACPTVCDLMTTNGIFYSYTAGGGWQPTHFRRTVTWTTVTADEIRISAKVEWYSGTIQRSFTMSSNMYRWINDGSGA